MGRGRFMWARPMGRRDFLCTKLGFLCTGARAHPASSKSHLLQASPSLGPAFPGHISHENT